MNRIIDIFNLSKYKENNRIEVKTAKKSVPASVWETYSSFANTEGGVILLGVEERYDHTLCAVGVEDSHKIVSDFWNTINNPQKVSVNILTNRMVHVETVDGFEIVVIEVPRAERSVRPIYMGNNPVSGSYRRNGEGDYHCSKDQIAAMLRDASDVTQDKLVLQSFNSNVFNSQTIKDYRARFRVFHESHVWNNDDDDLFLRHIGAIALSRDDQQYHPTAAGLLMFGNEYDITNEYPQYFLDYREEMDEGVRWTSRITSSSGDWSGNLYDFFFMVYPRLRNNLPSPFVLEDGLSRVDDSPAHIALREFLLNALAHADYYGRQGVVVRVTPSEINFANPGDVRIGLDVALQGGTSDPRNSTIMKMFGLVNIGDRAGSGMSNAVAAMRDGIGASVRYDVALNPERTSLKISFNPQTRDKTEKQGINLEKTRDKTEKQGIKTRDKLMLIDGISQKTRDNIGAILKYMDSHPVVKNHDIAELLNVGDDRARVLLMLLVDNGLLVANGERKERAYILRSDM